MGFQSKNDFSLKSLVSLKIFNFYKKTEKKQLKHISQNHYLLVVHLLFCFMETLSFFLMKSQNFPPEMNIFDQLKHTIIWPYIKKAWFWLGCVGKEDKV